MRGETLVRRVLIQVSNCTFEGNHAAVSGTTAGAELSNVNWAWLTRALTPPLLHTGGGLSMLFSAPLVGDSQTKVVDSVFFNNSCSSAGGVQTCK